MKVNKLSIETYGKLTDVTVDFDTGINIIYGPNESGKSTLFSSVETLLYGFSPANGAQHPLVNWEREEIVFRGHVTVEKKVYEIHRQLKTTPKYQLIDKANDTAFVGRNDSLPWVDGVSRTLYKSLYHFSAEDLAMFEKTSWETIQEKLVFNYGVDYLHKTSDVLSDIDQELKRIWRPDRRGNPELAELEKEIRGLERERHQYERAYGEIDEHLKALNLVEQQIEDAEKEKQDLGEKLQLIYHLLPIKEKHDQIDRLNSELVNVDLFSEMSEDALIKYNALSERLMEIEETRLAAKAEQGSLRAQLPVWTLHEERLWQYKQDVLNAEKHINAFEKLQNDIEGLAETLKTKYYQVEFLADKTFGNAGGALINYLQNLDLEVLKSEFIQLSKMHEQNEQVKMRLYEQRKSRAVLPIALLIIGGLGLALGTQYTPALWIGLVAIGIGIAELPQLRRKKEPFHPIDQVINQIKLKYDGLTFPEYAWTDKNLAFMSALDELNVFFEAISIETARMKDKVSERNHIKRQMIEALSECGVFDDVTTDEAAFINAYRRVQLLLENLEDKMRSQQIIEDKLNVVSDNLASVITKYEKVQNDILKYETFFLKLGSQNIEKGQQIFKDNLSKQGKINLLSDALNENPESLKSYEIFEPKMSIDPTVISQIESNMKMLDNTIKQAYIEKNQYEQKIAQIKKENPIEAIDSQLRIHREHVVLLKEKRNRLMVLKTLIQYSDEMYRKRHQPDILKRVSQFMCEMTGGKYEQVIITEGNELQFVIDGALYPISLAFSKGTINQLFLAFRLAVVETLSKSYEPLPIVLDEALINWDNGRLKNTFSVLEQMAKKHQIFIFSCHKWYENLGYPIIDLETID